MMWSQARLTINQKLQLVYYLLLQDRIAEAKVMFDSVKQLAASGSSASAVKSDSDESAMPCTLQLDYFTCYFSFFTTDPSPALAIAKRYANHPVLKQRKLFLEVENQLMEISRSVDPEELIDEFSKDPSGTRDNTDREREMANLAASEPTLDFSFASSSSIEIAYENVGEIKVNFFKMNVEQMSVHNALNIAMSSDEQR